MSDFRKRRINILIYEPYVFGLYGNTRYLTLISKYVDRTRFNPIFVAPHDGICCDIIREMGGDCIIVPPPLALRDYGGAILKGGMISWLFSMISIAKYTFPLSSLISRHNVDLVQCNNIRSLLTIGWAAKVTKRPCIWYIKGDLENKLLDRLGFMLADRILFLNETAKNLKYPQLVKQYDNKIRILKIGIDLDEIVDVEQKNKTYLKIELDINRKNLNIAFLGVVAPYKGLMYLIKALAEIRKKIPNIKLYIVGDYAVSEYKEFKFELDKIINKEHLNNNVVFTGWRADAREILSLMDIYVLPSLSEGVPRSIIEAMALGKPVVATDVGGVAETVLDGQTGFVVKPRDPKALADAIIKLAKDEKLRKKFGEKAKEIAFREYSIKTHIAKLEKIYLELLKGKNLKIMQ